MTTDSTEQTYIDLESDIVESRLRRAPATATAMGRHDWDAELGSRSREAIDTRSTEIAAQIHRLERIDAGTLVEPYRVRHDIHLRRLRAEHAEETRFGASSHSPGAPLATIGFACNSLMIRDFASAASRVTLLTGRLSAVPRLLQESRQNFESCTPIHAGTALQQAAGVLSMLEHDALAFAVAANDTVLLQPFEAARIAAVQAVGNYTAWLKDEVQPNASAPIAWGRERMENLVHLQEYVDTDIDTLIHRGQNDLLRHQERLRELAGQIDPAASPQDVVTRVGKDHPTAAELLPFVSTTLEELRQFCIDADLIEMPTEVRISLRETPAFSRATTLAACSTPGMYENVATEAFYYVTPPDAGWDAERTDQYLQFFNRWSLPLITAHEAYPGHYVHLTWLRKSDHAAPFTNTTTTVEGWGHYTERLMIEAGWGNGDPRYEVMQMREALLRLCRYLSAFGMHTQGWTYEQSVDFFMKEGFATRPVAELEAKRGVIGPSYFAYTLGKHEILNLRDALKAKWGAAFTLKRFHNALVKEPYPIAVIAKRLLAGSEEPL